MKTQLKAIETKATLPKPLGNKKRKTKDGGKMEIPKTFTYCKDVTNIKYLLDILSFRRPAGSKGEEVFISRYIEPLVGVQQDAYGNYYLHIPKPDGELADTAFTAHTDTVHVYDGMQPVYVMEEKGTYIASSDGKDVLGSDDGTGIWILLNMIHAEVPGSYYFFREEEVGGNGSDYFFKNMVEEWEHVNKVISFDRMGTNSIITHQMGGRCCSAQFAQQLGDAIYKISDGKLDMDQDPTGSFTDSANFDTMVPECTNLSVGYYHQHTVREYQDITFVQQLRDAMIKLDWSSIDHFRDPYKADKYDDDDLWDTGYGSISYGSYTPGQDEMDWNILYNIAKRQPDLAADLMYEYGITKADVQSELDKWELDIEDLKY